MALSTPKKGKLRQINNAGTDRWFCIKKIVKYADQYLIFVMRKIFLRRGVVGIIQLSLNKGSA